MKTPLLTLLIAMLVPLATHAAEPELAEAGWKPEVFKTVGDVDLNLWILKPEGHDNAGSTPAIVLYYGGGWKGRNISHFQQQGEHLASLGMVAILPDYRAESRYGGTPYDCVEDAKSAMRYVRANAAKHGIDPEMIAAGGGSAGGHLAAATALLPGLNAESDPEGVSCVPNALVLFNPVYDNGPGGYGHDRLKDSWLEISPMHHIQGNAPPNIVFLGSEDKLIPVETAEQWKEKMEAAGVRSDLHIYEDRGHGFFNKGEDYQDTLAKTVEFLRDLGYIKG